MQLKQDKMDKNSSLIERKVIMIPMLVIDNVIKIKVSIPTKHKCINGEYFPSEFGKMSEYIPLYKTIQTPKLITI